MMVPAVLMSAPPWALSGRCGPGAAYRAPLPHEPAPLPVRAARSLRRCAWLSALPPLTSRGELAPCQVRNLVLESLFRAPVAARLRADLYLWVRASVRVRTSAAPFPPSSSSCLCRLGEGKEVPEMRLGDDEMMKGRGRTLEAA